MPSALTLKIPTPPTIRATNRPERIASRVIPPTQETPTAVCTPGDQPRIAPRFRTLTSVIAAVASGARNIAVQP